AELMRASAEALLNGGTAPSLDGFDDETTLPRTNGDQVRAQLRQELRLVADLSATGDAVLHGRPVQDVRLTAHEHPTAKDPVVRLRILAALTANVSYNASRAVARATDRNISRAIVLNILLGL